MADLFVGAFQKGVKILSGGPYASGKYDYSSWTYSVSLGDFNNDGWVDIFNGGAACNGKAANLSFLIWNANTRVFEEQNLIADNTDYIGGAVRSISMYLNDDNYVDIVVIGHNDECAQGPAENCRVILSDGTGKYTITELVLEPDVLHQMFYYNDGDIGDLNQDNIPDLAIAAGTHTYIFWGQTTFPYFTNKGFAHFAADTLNFQSDNGFGEQVPGIGDVYHISVEDINSDGKNDLLLEASEFPNDTNRYMLNLGLGRFNETSIRSLPSLNASNVERIFSICDDLNNDGKKDIVGLDCTFYQSGTETLQKWDLVIYIQQQDGNFQLDPSWINYNINAASRPNCKWRLFYTDINKDGKKDIGYIDDAVQPTLYPSHDLKKKTIFLRESNKFVESDFYQFDAYAKSVREQFFP